MSRIFKTVSLTPGVSDTEIASMGVKPMSFMSFDRAISADIGEYGSKSRDEVLGYEVTDQGINIIYK